MRRISEATGLEVPWSPGIQLRTALPVAALSGVEQCHGSRRHAATALGGATPQLLDLACGRTQRDLGLRTLPSELLDDPLLLGHLVANDGHLDALLLVGVCEHLPQVMHFLQKVLGFRGRREVLDGAANRAPTGRRCRRARRSEAAAGGARAAGSPVRGGSAAAGRARRRSSLHRLRLHVALAEIDKVHDAQRLRSRTATPSATPGDGGAVQVPARKHPEAIAIGVAGATGPTGGGMLVLEEPTVFRCPLGSPLRPGFRPRLDRGRGLGLRDLLLRLAESTGLALSNGAKVQAPVVPTVPAPVLLEGVGLESRAAVGVGGQPIHGLRLPSPHHTHSGGRA
mmetsp:Transcript_43632/g.98511  ORF Transcript_43632/g.98511 Transcript_43632/m.98511 type:complete len:340 (+) Transcript_43632:603-1622(+)